jgi:hypothetical protein
MFKEDECTTNSKKHNNIPKNNQYLKQLLTNKIFLEDQSSRGMREFRCVKDEEVFSELYTNQNF